MNALALFRLWQTLAALHTCRARFSSFQAYALLSLYHVNEASREREGLLSPTALEIVEKITVRNSLCGGSRK